MAVISVGETVTIGGSTVTKYYLLFHSNTPLIIKLLQSKEKTIKEGVIISLLL